MIRVMLNNSKYLIKNKIMKRNKKIGRIREEWLDSTINEIAGNSIMLHVSLRAVKNAFGVPNPFTFLLGRLEKRFTNMIVPGFTHSFEQSRVYHKLFSMPEDGVFNKLFLPYSSSRTNDAIHSLLVLGPYDFSECDHKNTFSADGCFAKLDSTNTTIVDIGTEDFISTQLHFVESCCKVPYREEKELPGIIYYDETHFEHIEQITTKRLIKAAWNRSKIERYLMARGVLKKYKISNFNIRVFDSRDLRIEIEKKIYSDPYFLIT